MRVAVAGKGGSGKTTISATLSRLLARRGYQVTALDCDPNPNLAVALGVEAGERERLRRVPREEILEEIVDPDGVASLRLLRPLAAIRDEFGMVGPDGVGVLTMTGLLGAGRG